MIQTIFPLTLNAERKDVKIDNAHKLLDAKLRETTFGLEW